MALSITKNENGVVSIDRGTDGVTSYSNLTGVNIRYTGDAIYIKHSDGEIVLSYAEIVNIGGVAKPGNIKDTALLLANSFFIRVGGSGTTNATSDWFEMIDGVFYPKLSAFDARYGGGGLTQLAKSAITFGAVTSTQIILNWTAVPDATQYVVKSGSTTIYTGALLTFTHSSLTPETAYSYTVTASAPNFISSISDTATRSTNSSTGTGGLIAGKMISYGSNQTYDNVTGNFEGDGGANTTLANGNDTTTSTLAVSEIDIKYNAAWQGNFTNIGLSRSSGSAPYQTYDVGLLILDNLNVSLRTKSDSDGGGLLGSGYTVPANANSRLKIKLTNGVTNKMVEFFNSIDNGSNWVSRGAAVETAIPNSSPVYAHLFMASSSKVDNIKYTV